MNTTTQTEKYNGYSILSTNHHSESSIEESSSVRRNANYSKNGIPDTDVTSDEMQTSIIFAIDK